MPIALYGGSKETSNRGEKLTEYIINKGLTVHNTGPPTWKNIRYATHIDLTLSNEKMKGKIDGWKADFDIASTNHAICKVDLKYQGGPPNQKSKKYKYKGIPGKPGG